MTMQEAPKTQQQKVLIYCRVSDTKQKTEGHGLDSQEHRCRQYAALQGYVVEQVFADDFTGGGDFMLRPGMVALLNHLDRHAKTSYVVVFDDLKRFARDREFHFKLRDELALRHAKVECLNFRFEDTPEGEFIETIFAAQGQLERKQNCRQVIQKMKARMEQGYTVFKTPVGYAFKKISGHGKLPVRDEPTATVIQQALEGYATGRYASQVEVQRFLESQPAYPYKDTQGRVHPSRVKEILVNPFYAGYVEHQPWHVSLRKGQHEGLITLEMHEKIQHRLKGYAKAPARKDITADFPLRGFVLCADCNRPLTACWTQGKTKKFPYYLCYYKDCALRGKSIARDKVEGEFEALLGQLKPTRELFDIATAMFKNAWNQQSQHTAEMLKTAKHNIATIEKQIGLLVDRIIEASLPAVIGKYETRIAELEKEKLLLQETLHIQAKPHGSFEELFKLTLAFLANLQILWRSGFTPHRRAVLRLAFAERIIYCRETGLQTPKTSLPFRMLNGLRGQNLEMVEDRRFELLTS
jgi:site-specific DNA recombinase